MPSSSKEGKEAIRLWITEFSSNVKTVVDLGVGNGTYHKLFSHKSDLLRHARWIGVEVWEPYIIEYDLRNRYNHIENQDVRLIDYQQFAPIDLVFAGDVLEHMTKDEEIELMDKLLTCARRVIISIPIIHFPQDEVEGNPYERHIKDDWSHQEMVETFPQITQHWEGKKIGVYLLENVHTAN
jgi:hypothetical protein